MVVSECLTHFSVLRKKEEGRTLSLTIHHCQIGAGDGAGAGEGGVGAGEGGGGPVPGRRQTNREGLPRLRRSLPPDDMDGTCPQCASSPNSRTNT